MKTDLQLKVQSWLDGELPDGEVRRIGEWIARDAEASALAAELGGIREAMFRNEAAVALGESRDFYWSKIERQIQREAGQSRARATPWYASWRRYLLPALGAAVLACVVFVAVRQGGTPAVDEISSSTDGMEAVTFHDQSSQMTVIWLQDNTSATVETKPAHAPVRSQEEPETTVDM